MRLELFAGTQKRVFAPAKNSFFWKLCLSTRPLAMANLPLFHPSNCRPWYAATGLYASSTLLTCAASCLGRTAIPMVMILSSLMLSYWKFGQTIFFATCLSSLMVLKLLATMTDQHSGVLQAWHLSRKPSPSSCPTRMPSGMSNLSQAIQPCLLQSTHSSNVSRRMKFEREVRNRMQRET